MGRNNKPFTFHIRFLLIHPNLYPCETYDFMHFFYAASIWPTAGR